MKHNNQYSVVILTLTFIDGITDSWLGMNDRAPSNSAACKHYTINTTPGV